jgi:peptidoglycan hydrolase-like protein with peptidoglycan-binding domain
MELEPESDAQRAITPTTLILHSIAAPWTVNRIYEYWRDSTNLESHFGCAYDGDLGQFIGTNTRADANAGANNYAISVETASNLEHTDPWTDAQIETLINLGVWCHREHNIPLKIATSANSGGYGTHRMYADWSLGGTACPGDARQRQFLEVIFPGIVARAGGSSPPTQPEQAVVDLSLLVAAAHADPPKSGNPVSYSGAKVVEVALNKEGLLASNLVDGHFGTSTVAAYAGWQRRLGYSGQDADGYPGMTSLTKLGNKYGFRVVA